METSYWNAVVSLFFCKFRRRGLYRGFSSSLVSLFIVLFFFLVAAGANTLKFQSGTRGGRGLAAAAPVMISLASYRKIVFFLPNFGFVNDAQNKQIKQKRQLKKRKEKKGKQKKNAETFSTFHKKKQHDVRGNFLVKLLRLWSWWSVFKIPRKGHWLGNGVDGTCFRTFKCVEKELKRNLSEPEHASFDIPGKTR